MSTDVTPLGRGADASRYVVSPPSETAVETADGRFVAVVEPSGAGLESTTSRIVIQGPSGRPDVVLDPDAVNVTDLAWSPDGQFIAVCEGTLVSVARRGGELHRVYAGPGGPYPGACTELTWSADGSRLQFIQLEHAGDPALANPSRVVLHISMAPVAEEGAKQR